MFTKTQRSWPSVVPFSCGPKKLAGSKNGRCKRNVFVAHNFCFFRHPRTALWTVWAMFGIFSTYGEGGRKCNETTTNFDQRSEDVASWHRGAGGEKGGIYYLTPFPT